MKKIIFIVLTLFIFCSSAYATPEVRSCVTTVRLWSGTNSDSSISTAHMMAIESGSCTMTGCNSVYIDFEDRDLYATILSAVMKGNDSASATLWVQYKTEQTSKGLTMNYLSPSTCKLVMAGYRS